MARVAVTATPSFRPVVRPVARPEVGRPVMRRPVIGRVAIAGLGGPGRTGAAAVRPEMADPAALCEAAVTAAEARTRLPHGLLGAISLTETGRIGSVTGRLRPWPWSINVEGRGQFFATRQDAIAAVGALLRRGVRSIDVGCLQVNLMCHPRAFASLRAAFDPRENAGYAAAFLNALYTASRDWPSAIAAYHSETAALGRAYREEVMARWRDSEPLRPAGEGPVYADFAEVGRGSGAGMGDPAYAAFAPRDQIYGAFAPR
ncbi:hypothetical protein [Rhodopila sp.]|uniref:hypothetical protein n=1 Tax=Rhodopila sp. TaxID=2480087 RepID=UPI003D1274CB